MPLITYISEVAVVEYNTNRLILLFRRCGSRAFWSQISGIPTVRRTTAAVTNERWPRMPRKAIPVMGISGRSLVEPTGELSKCHFSRRPKRLAKSAVASVSARRAFWACTTGRSVARSPRRGWTCIAGHLFPRRWKMLFLSDRPLAGRPGQCLDSAPTFALLNWRTHDACTYVAAPGKIRARSYKLKLLLLFFPLYW